MYVYGGNMKDGLNAEVQRYVLSTYVGPAKVRGENTIRIKAGDVHRDLHWVNRVPSVCTTLGSKKFQRETGLELIEKEGPPSGMGTRAIFTYRLADGNTNDNKSVPPHHRKSLLDGLYGIAADVFRELGGSENFIRKEREKLHFIKREAEDDDEAKAR
jgi:hypothetical protein